MSEGVMGTGTLVTIGFIEGESRSGRIRAFAPHRPEIVLDPTGAEEPGMAKQLSIPAERIAYVAFHPALGASVPDRGVAGRKRLRVHTAGGKVFVVEVDVATSSNPLGFYAVPLERDVYRQIFFYSHGINAREADEPLGEMLVGAGVAERPDIQKGLAAQRATRPTLGQILVEQKWANAESVEQAAAMQQRKRMRIGEVLVQAGLITPDTLEAAPAMQKQRGGKRLGEILVEMKILTEQQLGTVLAAKFHLPFVNLEEYPVNLAAAEEVGDELIKKYRVLPLDTDARTLTVAIYDPMATEAVDALRFSSRKRITELVATRSQVEAYVDRWLSRERIAENEVDAILKALADEEDVTVADAASPVEEVNVTDSSVIKLVNQVIIDGYRRGASDIHVEPNSDQPVVVRFRVDGDCIAYQELPASLRHSIVARIKIMAHLDIAERRKPQDGKIRFKVKGQTIELRVATMPTVNQNEDVVMRILAGSKPIPIEQMGLSERNLRELKAAAEKPYGLVLCVGPTGSGKTTTLHSLLGFINTADRKIWTAEDPVEITQSGLRQVQMQTKIGLTFAVAMRGSCARIRTSSWWARCATKRRPRSQSKLL